MIKHPSWLKLKSCSGTLDIEFAQSLLSKGSAAIQNLKEGAVELGPNQNQIFGSFSRLKISTADKVCWFQNFSWNFCWWPLRMHQHPDYVTKISILSPTLQCDSHPCEQFLFQKLFWFKLWNQLWPILHSLLYSKSAELFSTVTSVLVTDIGDRMCWWQVWYVGDRFNTLKKSPT